MARKRIGELLLERKAITKEQLESGLAAQRLHRERLGATLVRQGAITDEQLAFVLSEALSIPRVNLKDITPQWDALSLMGPRFCEQNALLPYEVEVKPSGRKVLSVAMADPLNAPAIQELEFTTGMAVQVRLASLSAVKNAIMRYFYKTDPKQRLGSGEMVIFQSGVSRKIDRDGTEIITGEELVGDAPELELEQLIKDRQAARKKKKAAQAQAQGVDHFAKRGTSDVDRMEERFWALLRIMARKGLITREEFSQELDEADG